MITKRIGVYGIIPYVTGTPASTPYSDEFLRWLYDKDGVLSLRRYWRDVSDGELDVEATVFGFLMLEGQSYIDRLCQSSRALAANEAVKILFEIDQDPSPYDGLVFIVAGAKPVNAGSTGVQFGDRVRPVNLLDDRGSHSFMAHELGHLLGLDHSFDSRDVNATYKYGMYGDATCIMSAERFGGAPVTFPIPDGMKVFANGNAVFWDRAGPGVSMATLWRHQPDYPAIPGFMTELPALSPPQTVRLYRPGTGGTRLVSMPTSGPASRYTAEFRPAVQWDRGMPTAAAGVGAKAGVAIHQLLQTIGTSADGNGWPRTDAPNLVGIIPIPSTGDLDWSDANFGVRVVATGSGWVDVIVGAKLPALQSVTIDADISDSFVSSSAAESIQVSKTKFDCGVHTYTAVKSNLSVTIEAAAFASGFTDPQFRFELNGARLNSWTGAAATVSGAAAVNVAVQVPNSIKTHTTANRTINAAFTAIGNKITITLPPGDGAYEVSLVAFAADSPGSPAVPGTPSDAKRLPVTTATITLPPEAIADQSICVVRIAREMRQRQTWPPGDYHPEWTPPTGEETWSPADLATLGHRVLATAEFERQYPGIAADTVSDLATQLKTSATEVRQLAQALSRKQGIR